MSHMSFFPHRIKKPQSLHKHTLLKNETEFCVRIIRRQICFFEYSFQTKMTIWVRVILSILILLTIAVFVIQMVFGIQYIREPVECDRAKLLTILTLAGGCSGILSIIFVSCCCYRFQFGFKSSKPDRKKQSTDY